MLSRARIEGSVEGLISQTEANGGARAAAASPYRPQYEARPDPYLVGWDRIRRRQRLSNAVLLTLVCGVSGVIAVSAFQHTLAAELINFLALLALPASVLPALSIIDAPCPHCGVRFRYKDIDRARVSMPSASWCVPDAPASPSAANQPRSVCEHCGIAFGTPKFSVSYGSDAAARRAPGKGR